MPAFRGADERLALCSILASDYSAAGPILESVYNIFRLMQQK
jgi:hypothetical protein